MHKRKIKEGEKLDESIYKKRYIKTIINFLKQLYTGYEEEPRA